MKIRLTPVKPIQEVKVEKDQKKDKIIKVQQKVVEAEITLNQQPILTEDTQDNNSNQKQKKTNKPKKSKSTE